MYSLPLPPHAYSCSQFCSSAYAENEKASKQAKAIMPNTLPITLPQLTKLEQIGQSIVQPIILLFGS
ncbi:MAG: hypothetical protein WCD25_20870, partial [Pseudolabrys sp.]